LVSAGLLIGIPKIVASMVETSSPPEVSAAPLSPVPSATTSEAARAVFPCEIGAKAMEVMYVSLGMINFSFENGQYGMIAPDLDKIIAAYEKLKSKNERSYYQDEFTYDMQSLYIDLALNDLRFLRNVAPRSNSVSTSYMQQYLAFYKERIDSIMRPVYELDGETIREDFICP
jgi:hypothetical protein